MNGDSRDKRRAEDGARLSERDAATPPATARDPHAIPAAADDSVPEIDLQPERYFDMNLHRAREEARARRGQVLLSQSGMHRPVALNPEGEDGKTKEELLRRRLIWIVAGGFLFVTLGAALLAYYL